MKNVILLLVLNGISLNSDLIDVPLSSLQEELEYTQETLTKRTHV